MGRRPVPVIERVYAGLPFAIMVFGAMVALVYEMTVEQGVASEFGGKATLMVFMGAIGYFGGQAVNQRYLSDRPRSGERRRETLFLYGIGLWAALSVVNSTMTAFMSYMSTTQERSAILVIAAGPIEEAVFRFLLLSMMFRAFVRVFQGLPLPFVDSESRVRLVAMLMSSVITSLAFVQFHVAVLEITSPEVFTFLFVNSMIYCLVYLKTGDPVTTTTAHTLHNMMVVFF